MLSKYESSQTIQMEDIQLNTILLNNQLDAIIYIYVFFTLSHSFLAINAMTLN
jgi:hypothetical protein